MPQLRAQRAVGNARLHVHLRQVEYGHTGRFAARSRGGGHGDVRPQRARYGDAAADGRVHVVEKVGRVGGIEIGRLGRVDGGAAANRKVAVESARAREGDRVLKGVVGRLHPRLVIQDGVDPLRAQRTQRHRDRLAARQAPVRHDHHPPRAQPLHVVPDLPRRARAVLDAGRVHREGCFPCLRRICHRLSPV